MNQSPEKLFQFGEFRLDTAEKLLWKGEKSVALPPKVLDVLCLLVERQGKIVSKNEIMDAVWADSFVEESNLTQSIYTLRRILGNDENGKSIVETIPRRGFRIAVPIEVSREAGGREAEWARGEGQNKSNSRLPTPDYLLAHSSICRCSNGCDFTFDWRFGLPILFIG